MIILNLYNIKRTTSAFELQYKGAELQYCTWVNVLNYSAGLAAAQLPLWVSVILADRKSWLTVSMSCCRAAWDLLSEPVSVRTQTCSSDCSAQQKTSEVHQVRQTQRIFYHFISCYPEFTHPPVHVITALLKLLLDLLLQEVDPELQAEVLLLQVVQVLRDSATTVETRVRHDDRWVFCRGHRSPPFRTT